MTVSDRIYLFLAEGTQQYDQLVDIVGEPSSASPSKSPAQEYIDGIDLESEANPFSKRLEVYGDVPVSTFSILC
jgi:hypothetical protein